MDKALNTLSEDSKGMKELGSSINVRARDLCMILMAK